MPGVLACPVSGARFQVETGIGLVDTSTRHREMRLMKAYPIVIGLFGLLASELPAQTNSALDPNKVGYSLGFKVGGNWRGNEMQDVQLEAVMQGIRDALAGQSPKFTAEEMNSQLSLFQVLLQERVATQRDLLAERNKTAGERFLADNKRQPGVVALPSGLQYKVIQPGNGPGPALNDKVVVHYRGSLLNGTEFDNSYKRGTPSLIPVGDVMRGWGEALQLMSVGAKWQLFIPSELAYGAGGFPDFKVGPNETLLFDAELIEIRPPVASSSQPVTSDIVRVPSVEEMAKGAQIEIIKPENIPQPK